MDSDWTISLEFMKAHPSDAARILERVRIEETVSFLNGVPASLSSRVIEWMETSYASRCLERMNPKRSAAVLGELPLELAALCLRPMEEPLRKALFENLAPGDVDSLRRMLSYPEGTVGAVMTPLVFSLPGDVSVREALKRFRRQSQSQKDYCYVVDRDHLLIGAVPLCEIVRSDPNAFLSELVRTDLGRLAATDNQQTLLGHPSWEEVHELPVVDEKGLLVGAIDYRTFRRLERKAKREGGSDPMRAAGSALGELYRIALTGFIKGATSPVGFEEE